eukprot:CAMPEP_0168397428 /NCGR_PEP_ID=MMETSP0228-20121227/21059_1 /TAXON_ID=133427 /ORGANISM="Protoceratium reticulatum, Strain CCCM 535 (=CCMP 1889)" /LENGTH=41 /DNA_ID= /DNA_START= /DNA_END= /DNA_ORIENTATION=
MSALAAGQDLHSLLGMTATALTSIELRDGASGGVVGSSNAV